MSLDGNLAVIAIVVLCIAVTARGQFFGRGKE